MSSEIRRGSSATVNSSETFLQKLSRKLPGSAKLQADAAWNILSFGLIGASGVLLILLVARFYSPDVLGHFNLVYSIYIILSQLVGAGIHFSVLRYIAEQHHVANEESSAKVLSAALLASALNSLLWIGLFLLVKGQLVRLFGNEELEAGLWFIVPALLFCGQNKVLLAFLNAREEFRCYAVLNASRAVVLCVTAVSCVALNVPGVALPVVFTLSEFALYVLLVSHARSFLQLNFDRDFLQWMRTHLDFGYRSVVGSLFIDINTRIDVLVLGVYCSVHDVGVYSYAAMLIDGFTQLPIVLRTIVNPKLTRAYFHEGPEAFVKVVREGRRLSYMALVPIGLFVVAAYYPIVYLLKLSPEFLEGFLPLAVLMSGSLVSIGYAPFLMVFNQVGRPNEQSMLYFAIFSSNLVLNLLLVPYFGMLGSAIGTALAYLSFVFILRGLAWRKLGVRL